MITLIVARARNGAIGRNGTIPWDIPQDLKAFQRETLGGALVMGRSTWNSLPVKPLPRRLNIVVSSSADAADNVVSSIADGILRARQEGYHRIYGIGGARIYQEMLPLADRLLISEVGMEVEDADTFFADFDPTQWTLEHAQTLQSEGPECIIKEYLRKDDR